MMDAGEEKKPGSSYKRWWLWLPLLGLSGWLALFGDKSPAGSAGVAASLPTPAPPAPGATDRPSSIVQAKTNPEGTHALLPLIAREALIARVGDPETGKKASARDLFSVRNWNPPPPPAPPPEVAPAPVAPALPFSFIGKKLESDAWEVYLGRGEQTYIVREGQVLDGLYRVDKIEPPMLALTYLPLGQAQTLPIGDTR